jgi:uncharacterized protein (DUF2236 family)
MRGIWQNSTFMTDPVGRLRRTADFVVRTTFGRPEDAEAAGRRVRGLHRRLRVADPGGGPAHRVDDPELLLWVHCAEVSSYLEVAGRAGLALNGRQADRYVAEQRAGAALVGLRPEEVPGSRAELAAYLDGMRPLLRPTAESAAVVRFLLRPRLPRGTRFAAPVEAAYLPFGALCYHTLPGWARRMHGALPEVPEAAVSAALRAFRLGLGLLPERVHELAFLPGTRRMLTASRGRLAEAGYDVSRGLRGLTDPRRWPPRER